MKLHSLVFSLYACSITIGAAQFTLTGFPPSQYTGGDTASLAQMRTNLGIQNLIIEDFVGLALSPGRLSITATTGTSYGIIPEVGVGWGATGNGMLAVTLSQATGSKLKISVQGGTRKLGLGFSALASGIADDLTALAVNGGALLTMNSANLPAFQFRDGARNGYLVIEAPAGGPLIQQIELSQISGLDGFHLDYIAYGEGDPVPTNPVIGLAVVFKFQSALGAAYTIQGSLDLQTWTDEVTGITGDGKIMEFFFEQKTPRKFYRLKP